MLRVIFALILAARILYSSSKSFWSSFLLYFSYFQSVFFFLRSSSLQFRFRPWLSRQFSQSWRFQKSFRWRNCCFLLVFTVLRFCAMSRKIKQPERNMVFESARKRPQTVSSGKELAFFLSAQGYKGNCFLALRWKATKSSRMSWALA